MPSSHLSISRSDVLSLCKRELRLASRYLASRHVAGRHHPEEVMHVSDAKAEHMGVERIAEQSSHLSALVARRWYQSHPVARVR